MANPNWGGRLQVPFLACSLPGPEAASKSHKNTTASRKAVLHRVIVAVVNTVFAPLEQGLFLSPYSFRLVTAQRLCNDLCVCKNVVSYILSPERSEHNVISQEDSEKHLF